MNIDKLKSLYGNKVREPMYGYYIVDEKYIMHNRCVLRLEENEDCIEYFGNWVVTNKNFITYIRNFKDDKKIEIHGRKYTIYEDCIFAVAYDEKGNGSKLVLLDCNKIRCEGIIEFIPDEYSSGYKIYGKNNSYVYVTELRDYGRAVKFILDTKKWKIIEYDR